LAGLRESPTAFVSSYEEECDTPLSLIAERLIAGSDRAVFGAFANDELVGVVGLQRHSEPKLAHKAYVWGMYVAPGFRSRGIGRELLEHVLRRAASMSGLHQVNLGANSANAAAIALYETAGFRSFGLERGFLLIDGVLHDELHMARAIH